MISSVLRFSIFRSVGRNPGYNNRVNPRILFKKVPLRIPRRQQPEFLDPNPSPLHSPVRLLLRLQRKSPRRRRHRRNILKRLGRILPAMLLHTVGGAERVGERVEGGGDSEEYV